MAELKPCPFCGSTDVGGSQCKIYCYVCNAEIRGETTEQAAVKWNTRALTPAQQHADEMYLCLQEELELIQDAISQLTLKSALFSSVVERIVKDDELLTKARGD